MFLIKSSTQKSTATEKHLPRWFDILWLLVLSAYILAGISLVPLHGDESTQTYMARDFYTLFVERDLSQLSYGAWDTLDGQAATEQDLRLKDGVTAPLSLWCGCLYGRIHC
ncbi:MAG: hypothetical protein Q9P01_02290 [Anaerolineae bacterium]|nr:hypothetical protein [Anaerolineae bacterium]